MVIKKIFNHRKNCKIVELYKLKVVLLTFADQAFYSGANFLTGILVGRLLSIGDLGSFSLGMTLLTFSIVFQDNLLATPYTYHLYQSDATKRKNLRAGALVQSLLLASFCALLLITAGLLTSDFELRAILLAIGITLPLFFLRECLRRQFFAEYQMMQALLLDIGVCVLQFSLIAVLWFNAALAPHLIFVAMALSGGIGIIIAIVLIRKQFDFSHMTIRADLRENMRFGRWLMLGSFCHLASLYSYPWIIYLMHGSIEAGAFAACFSLVNLLNPFILGFNNFFRAKIIQTHREKGPIAMHTLIIQALLLFIPIGILIAVFLAWAGGWLVELVYGKQFAGLGNVIAILGVSILPILLSAPLQLGILALNKPQINPIFHMFALGITLLIGIPIAMHYGMIAASIGYVLATSGGCVVLWFLYKREICLALSAE